MKKYITIISILAMLVNMARAGDWRSAFSGANAALAGRPGYLRPLAADERNGRDPLYRLNANLQQRLLGHISVPLNASFAVDLSPERWEFTNQDRIIDAVSQWEGVTLGEKACVACAFLGYTQNTAFSGNQPIVKGGSIVNISFSPLTQSFHVEVVDTQGYPESDSAAWLRRTYKISMKELVRYAPADLIKQDIKNLYPVDIGPAPNNPVAALKVALFILASKHPAGSRVMLRSESLDLIWRLRVFYNDTSGALHLEAEPFLTELSSSDFLLSEAEGKLDEAKKAITEAHEYLYRLLFGAEMDNRLEELRRWGKDERICGAAEDLYQNFVATKSTSDSLAVNLDRLILGARKEMRSLTQKETGQLLDILTGHIGSFERALESVPIIFEGHPELKDEKEAQAGDSKQQKTMQELFEEANAILQELLAIRVDIIRNHLPVRPALPVGNSFTGEAGKTSLREIERSI
ncbi:MAG: hypothetical protein ABH825_03390 [Candidatus Omnitrophota bacterium]